MAISVEFVEPWHAVSSGQAKALEEELQRELAPRHALFKRRVRARARRQDRDDVLFELEDSGECAVVHLTWSGRPEPESFPSTVRFQSVQVWATTGMQRDHKEFEGAD